MCWKFILKLKDHLKNDLFFFRADKNKGIESYRNVKLWQQNATTKEMPENDAF